MATAMASHCDVSSAAHVPEGADTSITALRLEGFPPSVQARIATLGDLLREYGMCRAMEGDEENGFWLRVRDAAPLGRESTLWRAVIAPSSAESFLDEIRLFSASWILDWAGGLVWLSYDGDSDLVRSAAARAMGHATLWRAPVEVRTVTSMFHPGQPPLARLEERVRRAFDPAGVFETGRFRDKHHAD